MKTGLDSFWQGESLFYLCVCVCVCVCVFVWRDGGNGEGEVGMLEFFNVSSLTLISLLVCLLMRNQ